MVFTGHLLGTYCVPCTPDTNCTKDKPLGAASAQLLGTPSTTLSSFCPELPPVGGMPDSSGSGWYVST